MTNEVTIQAPTPTPVLTIGVLKYGDLFTIDTDPTKQIWMKIDTYGGHIDCVNLETGKGGYAGNYNTITRITSATTLRPL